VGESVEYGGRRYTVLEMERNRIARVRIEKLPDETDAKPPRRPMRRRASASGVRPLGLPGRPLGPLRPGVLRQARRTPAKKPAAGQKA